MKKKCKLIMLPTNKSNIGYRKDYGLNTLQIRNKPLIKSSNTWQAVNLYITSDDEIKEDDWFIYRNYKVLKCTNLSSNKQILIDKEVAKHAYYGRPQSISKKIIATTDASLTNVTQLSQDLIQAYCNEPFDEIEVEYYDNAYNVRAGTIKSGYKGLKKDLKPKTDSSNNIITSLIKDSYSREEVEDLFRKFNAEYSDLYSDTLQRWFNINL